MSTATLPQNMVALEEANRIRVARADLKRSIREGGTTARAVILDPPAYAENMPLGDVLRAQVRWGQDRIRRRLGPTGIKENRTLGDLEDRERLVVVSAL